MNKEKLIKVLTDYFGLNNFDGSYTYELTRDKSGFEVDTVTLDDFEEFDIDQIEDLANYIIENIKEMTLHSETLKVEDIIVGKHGVWYYGEECVICGIDFKDRIITLKEYHGEKAYLIRFELFNEIVGEEGYFEINE